MRLLLHSQTNSAKRNVCTNSTICRTLHDMETTVTGQSQKAQLNLWFNYHIYSHVSTFLSAQIYFKTSSFYRFIFFTLKNINCLSLTHSCTPPFYAHVIRIWKFFYIKISEIFIFFY